MEGAKEQPVVIDNKEEKPVLTNEYNVIQLDQIPPVLENDDGFIASSRSSKSLFCDLTVDNDGAGAGAAKSLDDQSKISGIVDISDEKIKGSTAPSNISFCENEDNISSRPKVSQPHHFLEQNQINTKESDVKKKVALETSLKRSFCDLTGDDDDNDMMKELTSGLTRLGDSPLVLEQSGPRSCSFSRDQLDGSHDVRESKRLKSAVEEVCVPECESPFDNLGKIGRSIDGVKSFESSTNSALNYGRPLWNSVESKSSAADNFDEIERRIKTVVEEGYREICDDREQLKYNILQKVLMKKPDAAFKTQKKKKQFIYNWGSSFRRETGMYKRRRSACEVVLDSGESPLEPSTSCVFIKKTIHVEDEKKLTYVPYFGEDDDEDIVSGLFHTGDYQMQLSRGPKFLQEEKTLMIDQMLSKTSHKLRRLIGENARDANSTLLKRIGAEVMDVDTDWIGERQSNLCKMVMDVVSVDPKSNFNSEECSDQSSIQSNTEDSYLRSLDTFRSLFCRQCFSYDCNLHGNLEKPSLKLQYELGIQKCHDRFWEDKDIQSFTPDANWNEPPGSFPLGQETELTEFQKSICHRLFLVFQGNVNKIASTICAPSRLVFEYINLKQMSIPKFTLVKKDPVVESRLKSNAQNMKSYNQTWLRRVQKTTIHPFFHPCCHDEPCSEQNCPCVKFASFCTPACTWGYRSRYFFLGCNCKGSCMNNHCSCVAAKRECDPDLCKNCGCCTDAPHKPATTQKCRNDNISMRRHRRLLVAKSSVAGWGLFTKDALRKGDYIHEYVGELVSQEEADRRGQIYDKQNRSYLFNLSSDYVVDSTRKGNKTRFINHSDNPNCTPRICLVKGVYRIGLFAKENIKPQSELFFDYGYRTTLSNPLIVKLGKTVDWMEDPKMASKISKVL